MSKSATEQLSRLLDTERQALLSGDLSAVGELTAEKEALVETFESSNIEDLRLLATALTRNSALLVAAREGVADVLGTLRKQRDARMSLSSYDSSGKATKIEQPSRATERRF